MFVVSPKTLCTVVIDNLQSNIRLFGLILIPSAQGLHSYLLLQMLICCKESDSSVTCPVSCIPKLWIPLPPRHWNKQWISHVALSAVVGFEFNFYDLLPTDLGTKLCCLLEAHVLPLNAWMFLQSEEVPSLCKGTIKDLTALQFVSCQ